MIEQNSKERIERKYFEKFEFFRKNSEIIYVLGYLCVKKRRYLAPDLSRYSYWVGVHRLEYDATIQRRDKAREEKGYKAPDT